MCYRIMHALHVEYTYKNYTKKRNLMVVSETKNNKEWVPGREGGNPCDMQVRIKAVKWLF